MNCSFSTRTTLAKRALAVFLKIWIHSLVDFSHYFAFHISTLSLAHIRTQSGQWQRGDAKGAHHSKPSSNAARYGLCRSHQWNCVCFRSYESLHIAALCVPWIERERDIIMEGHVSWVGRSSAEATIQCLQQGDRAWKKVQKEASIRHKYLNRF